jgi:hypothetical protein
VTFSRQHNGPSKEALRAENQLLRDVLAWIVVHPERGPDLARHALEGRLDVVTFKSPGQRLAELLELPYAR